MTETRESVKARFKAEGVTIRDWARRHGFDERAVQKVLSGRVKCNYGISHQMAVALGLKEEPETVRFRDDEAA